MNIMIAASNLMRINGGVCTHVLDLCRCLIDKGDRVILLFDGTEFSQQIRNMDGLQWIELPFMKADRSVGAFMHCCREMLRLCKEKNIDIIHLHGQRIIPMAWIIRCICRVPFVWTNHIDAIPQPRVLSIMHAVMRFPVISVSTDLKKQLIEELHFRQKYIRVINNGIHMDSFTPLSLEEQACLRKEYGIRSGDYVVAELGRINHIKGQNRLVRAVKAVQDRYPQMRFKVLIAGSGDMAWYQENVESFAKENRIDCAYLGFRKPREVFGVADLSAMPSLYEGFGLVCTESLAMGCPVIRSDSPGWSDMQEYCLVCKKGDQQELNDILEYAVTHREEMQERAARGRKACQEIFCVENMTRCTREYYLEIVEKQREAGT